MNGWRRLLSPWLILSVALWIGFMIAGTIWAIPVFANVASPGLSCTPTPCSTVVTTEWIPSILFGAVAGTIVAGVLLAAAGLIRRPR